MKTTLLESLNYDDDQDIENEKELTHMDILDFSLPTETRLKMLEEYQTHHEHETLEIINKINSIYFMSGLSIIEKFLIEAVMNSKISDFYKVEMAKTLCLYSRRLNENEEKSLERKKRSFSTLSFLLGREKIELPLVIKIQAILVLMTSSDYKEEASSYFSKIINKKELGCEFRYKTILTIENQKEILYLKDWLWYTEKAFLDFFNNHENDSLYRILASQNILRSSNSNIDKDNIEELLLNLALDDNETDNRKADAADTLLSLSSNPTRINQAKKIIITIGIKESDGCVHTLFNNSQNVHNETITQSVKEILKFLAGLKYKSSLSLDKCSNEIRDLIITKPDDLQGRINVSLSRIQLDKIVYPYNLSLGTIFMRVWSYIKNHEYRKSMTERLIEELNDMSDTCSSGFVSRICNSITGYGEFNLRISYFDQIKANFSGRLNKIIRDLPSSNDKSILKYLEDSEKDLEWFQEQVINEMTIEPSKVEERKHFLLVFSNNFLKISNELRQEFLGLLDQDEFELYIRKALAAYEGFDF